MTLVNLCQLFDTYYIAKHKSELNRKYLSSSELIFSDGDFDHHIDKDGYIVVPSLSAANYFMYIDQSGNLCLWIYELTPETMYKEIVSNMNKVREQTRMHRHTTKPHNKDGTTYDSSSSNDLDRSKDEIIKSAPAEIVNINKFLCTMCSSSEFVKTKTGSNIILVCKKCKTKFKLIPSKYYIIKSITMYNDLTANGINDYIEEVENDEDQN